MNKDVNTGDITPVIEELIASGTDVRLTITGNSMFPMLRSKRDSVIITKAPAVLKKYDLPLYKRENGSYILHRIIKAKDDVYCMNGDNQYFVEKGIKRSQIVGIVSSFTRGGREIECSDIRYKLYCRFWVTFKPFRGLINKIYVATIGKIKTMRRKK